MVYFDIAAAGSLLEWRNPLSSSRTGTHTQKPVVFPASRRDDASGEPCIVIYIFTHTHTKMMSDSGQVIVRPHLK